MKKYMAYVITITMVLSSCGTKQQETMDRLERENKRLYVENLRLRDQVKSQSKQIDELTISENQQPITNKEIEPKTDIQPDSEKAETKTPTAIESVQEAIDFIRVGLIRDINTEYVGAELIVPKTEKPIKMLTIELEALDTFKRKAYCSIRNTSTTMIVLANPTIGVIEKHSLWKNSEIKFIDVKSVEVTY